MRRIMVVVAAVGALVCSACADLVRVSGGDGADDGLLVNGLAGGTTHLAERFTGVDGSSITVGPFDGGPGEVIAYTVGHGPTVNTPVTWTSGGDQITFTFGPRYRIPFHNWIVQGPFTGAQARAINACIRTAQIWRDERQGTSFSRFDITDATANTNAGTYTAFTCSLVNGIKNDIGFDANAVNVYWVNTVDFGNGAGTGNGVWCGGNVVAMGSNVLDHLFSHEIGHAFSLEHINTLTTFFDQTNVMHNASNFRAFLTEGQTMRAVMNANSVVNTLAGRTGVTRTCGNSTAMNDPACPAVQKRIWADGAAWPPN